MNNEAENISLSKTVFLRSVTQCALSGFLHFKKPELRKPISSELQAIFDEGTYVGKVARDLFRGGIDVIQSAKISGLTEFEETERLLASGAEILYEAAFQTPDRLHKCRVDILVRIKDRTDLYEVKSSTKFKMPQHLYDLGYQYWVIMQTGLISKLNAHICHINKEYVAGENIDIDELFTSEDVTKRVKNSQPLIERMLLEFHNTLNRKSAPQVNMGQHCVKPYPCEFFVHCKSKLPEFSVFDIGGIRKTKAEQLIEKGIVDVNQLSEKEKLSQKQWTEVEAAITNRAKIKKAAILKELKSYCLDEDVYFADFETTTSAIPIYAGTRPYQHLCFQYCALFRPANKQTYQRFDFLAMPGEDPRRAFIESFLRDTPGAGKIIAYNAKFEIEKLGGLATEFPEYSHSIKDRIDRMVDLAVIFKERYYYSPLQRGEASLKAITPILAPHLSYKSLAIQNGQMAMTAYRQLPSMNPAEQLKVIANLKEYCHLDVLTMKEIISALQKLCK
jgi:predicted RecB family nuclease